MVCFRELFALVPLRPAQVGVKAATLAQLKRWGLPVPPTWVLGAEAWEALLAHVGPLEHWGQLDAIARQQTARDLRQRVQAYPLDLDWSHLTVAPPLILRSSLALINSQGEGWQPQSVQGLLAGQICADSLAYTDQLKRVWAQALGAHGLTVWPQYCQQPEQLRLGVIAQPLVPSVLSGTLVLSGQRGLVEAVAGWGGVLSRGEAQPARCHIDDEQFRWQSGHQERGAYWDAGATQLTWQWRPDPILAKPLQPAQVHRLLQLGQQIQRRLGPVRLEWLLTERPGTGPDFVITQADQYRPAWEEMTAAAPSPPLAPSPESPPPEPELPTVQAAMRGLAAASGRGLAPAVVVRDPAQMPATFPERCIVVAHDIQPDIFGRVGHMMGIVTESGGATCHAAILARELGIPAVVGAPEAVSLIQTGDYLWLDGDKGMVYILSEADQTPWLQRPSSPAPSEPLATRTQVMVNLSQASRLGDYVGAVDGVGLIRSEWMLLDGLQGQHPQQWIEAGLTAELAAVIVERMQPVLAACAGKPVRYRSLDLRSHEWRQLRGSPQREVNPMLGLRGTFSYQQDFRLFQTELAALRTLQRSGHHNLELILPFVRTVEEVHACQRQIRQAGLSEVAPFRLWVMAEVPSVLFLLPAYAQAGVQGIAIGTNDLTQLLLAVDREQPLLAATYDERHPAVLAALRHLIHQARNQGMNCSLCGQAPVRFPELIDLLVGWGINSICVEPAAVGQTRSAVFAAEHAQSLAQSSRPDLS